MGKERNIDIGVRRLSEEEIASLGLPKRYLEDLEPPRAVRPWLEERANELNRGTRSTAPEESERLEAIRQEFPAGEPWEVTKKKFEGPMYVPAIISAGTRALGAIGKRIFSSPSVRAAAVGAAAGVGTDALLDEAPERTLTTWERSRMRRRRRRRNMLTASDTRDIGYIVGTFGKGSTAMGLINQLLAMRR